MLNFGPSLIKPARWPLHPHLTTAPELWDGLVALWAFWEGGGATVRDLRGGYNASFSSSTVDWVSMQTGIAVDLRDDNSDHLTLTEVTDFELDNFTYFAQCKPLLVDHELTIYGKETNGPWNKLNIQGSVDGGNVRGTVTAGGSTVDVDGTSNRGNLLTNCALSFDGATAQIFVDGIQEGSSALSGTANYDGSSPRIGRRSSGAANPNYFNGFISLLAIWDRALMDAEHRLLGSDPFAALRPGPQAIPLLFGTVATSSGRTLTVSLVNADDTALPNLTGIRWKWFDESSVDGWTIPTDQGIAESTDGSGLLSIDLANTTLVSGQTGSLVIESSGGGRRAWANVTLP